MTEPVSNHGARPNEPLDEEPRVDRSAFSVFSSFEEADAEDDAYWLSRTPAERMARLELLRRINYGDAATGRLQRVPDITWAPWSQVPADRRVRGERSSR